MFINIDKAGVNFNSHRSTTWRIDAAAHRIYHRGSVRVTPQRILSLHSCEIVMGTMLRKLLFGDMVEIKFNWVSASYSCLFSV